MSYSCAVESLSELIKFRTISDRYNKNANIEQFDALRSYIKVRYPKIFEVAIFEEIGNSGLLFKIKGKSSESPSVLMAHYDVVPVTDNWEIDPFGGIIKDDVLWGRGTIDTKVTFCAVLETVEEALQNNFEFANDLYLSFSGEEEPIGSSTPDIVKVLDQRGIRPAFVLDEGGAIVSNVFPGVKERCALIGIAEKGMMDLKFTATSKAGHASAPPKNTAVGKIAQAVCKIEKKPFKQRMTLPVENMFIYMGSHSQGAIKFLFKNMWLTSGIVKAICKAKGGEMAAMTRTTCAITMAEGSKQANILPKTASVTANIRIIQGDTVQGTIDRLKSIVGEEIVIEKITAFEPTKISKLDDKYEMLASTIRESWENALVSPYLMMAYSDSRHYSQISDNVYKFCPLELTSEERATIHADNERIPVYKVDECVNFYRNLLSKL